MLRELFKRIFSKTRYTVVENPNLLIDYHGKQCIIRILDKDVKGRIFLEYIRNGKFAVLLLNNESGSSTDLSQVYSKAWFITSINKGKADSIAYNTHNIRVAL